MYAAKGNEFLWKRIRMFIESFVSLLQASNDSDYVSSVIQQLDTRKEKGVGHSPCSGIWRRCICTRSRQEDIRRCKCPSWQMERNGEEIQGSQFRPV